LARATGWKSGEAHEFPCELQISQYDPSIWRFKVTPEEIPSALPL
jgi:hypothetical protein